MTDAALRAQLRPFLKGEAAKVEAFLALCSYIHGEVGGWLVGWVVG
jgi:hypothetical protein